MLNALNNAVKILDSYQKFINNVMTERIKFCETKKNSLARALYLFRLLSRSINGR